MKLVVVIPALNEAATIGAVVRGCLTAALPLVQNVSVLVVNDGSTDETARLAREAGAEVLTHTRAMGVGRAFRDGLNLAVEQDADLVVNIDGDGQFDPAGMKALLAPILEGHADCTTASRFKTSALMPDMPYMKLWGNQMMSHIISAMAGQTFYDVSCGFRAYSREAAMRLNLWGDFTYTQESILELVVKGMRISEVPLPVQGRRKHGDSRVAANLWAYGWRSLTIILQTFRDYWPMRFFGVLALIAFVPGTAFVTFLLAHRFWFGMFTPHIWSGFVGGSLLFFALLMFMAGWFAEILKRIRLNQEYLVYVHKKMKQDGAAKPHPLSTVDEQR